MRTATCYKSVNLVIVAGLSLIERNIEVVVKDSSFRTQVGMVGSVVLCGAMFCTIVV